MVRLRSSLRSFAVVVAILCCGTGKANAQASDAMKYAAAQRELNRALAPLKSLDEQQTRAVATLVMASRAGFDVTDYCPPLRHFDFAESVPCLGAMAAYARAEKDCKVANPTPGQCPRLYEAEANWLACDMRRLEGLLSDIRLIQRSPVPRGR
jgi:hypothetical protein